MLAPDAFQSTMTEGKIELPDETTSAESEPLPTQSDHLFFNGGGSFAGLTMGSAGDFAQTARSLLLITAQPLAHGGNRGLEKTSGGLDTSLPSRLHQPQAMIVGVSPLANQDEVGGGHGGL